MIFKPFEASAPHVVYAALGGFVVLFGMFSLLLREKLYIGEACWAFLFGVIIGPYCANVFDPRGWGGNEDDTNTITLEITRVVLAIGVFAIGVELPKAYMARHWKSLFFLLVPVMTWGWFVSAGLIYALIPGLNFLSSLAVAACLTPTDPILAAAVVGGKYADKHVPAHIRHLLAAESGCNDGAAFPFLYIALYLIIDSPNTGHAIRDWVLQLWLYQVVLGVVIGSIIGFSFRHLMKFCERHDLIDRHSYVAQYVSLAILTIGACTLLGSDDLLAAFACGTAFAWDGFFNRQTEESVFSSVIDLLFNIAAFVFVGAWMPFSSFTDGELTLSVWRLIVIAILVLLLRRLPAMIALYRWIPDIKTFREAVFSGHFGPIGVGAVFISTLATQVLNDNADESNTQTQLLAKAIQPIVAFMVLCSITIHGLSIPGFSLGRRVHSVSRTWSRHAPPDWTNQARLVDRGADNIVINRDSELERGELTPIEKLPEEARTRTASEAGTSSTPEKTVFEDGDAEHPSEPAHEHEGERTTEEQAKEDHEKEETPPDGNEIIAEWREGHHAIIERRAGPGEEVEVEVIRNVDGDERRNAVLSGNEGAVHPHISAYMDKLRQAPHIFEHDAEKVGKAIEHDLHAIEQRAKQTLSPRPSPSKAHEEDEEDEGWASDRSGEPADSVTDRRKRSKSPKVKPSANIQAQARKGRRRNSIRRGLIGHAQQFMHSHQAAKVAATTEDADPDSGRGRTQDTRDNASASTSSRPDVSRPRSGYNTPRHARLDSIRALHSAREVSPARSVRFADDDNRSGYNTPRSVLGDSTPGTPAEGVAGEDHEHDPARSNKVTFDLPRLPKV